MESQKSEQIKDEKKDSSGQGKITLKQRLRIIFLTLLAILLITFVVQNSNRIEIEFLNMNFRVRIIYVILSSAIIGGILGVLLLKIRAAKKKKSK
ncbi:LapA family protein [Crocinitomix algicola]|uniref:hypothetical protein n=1 Tax=Crocinitomix algicola TaxID=1740263 RepID=UPI001112D265|nr:hypothetical protein [Crocinitomix algicola]